MAKKILITIIVIVLLGAGATILLSREPAAPLVPSDCTDQTGRDAMIVYLPDRTFSPYCVMLSAGSTITWENASNAPLQIGTDPHPIHTGNKELSNGEFTLDVNPGESTTVTLTTPGAFGYHNHVNSSAIGIIVVE